MLNTKRILAINGGTQTNFITEKNEILRNAQLQIQRSGGNIGNIVFKDSILRELGHLNCVDLCWWEVKQLGIHFVNDNFDIVVCTCANTFRHKVKYLEYLSEVFDKVTIPFVIIGIGAEDDIDLEDPEDALMVESLKKLTRRSVIGTRGEFTTKTMAKHGITNTMTIGCPSLFSPLEKEFAVLGVNKNSKKIALNTELWNKFWEPLYYGKLDQISYFPQNETGELFENKDEVFNVPDERKIMVRNLADSCLYPNMEVWVHELKKCRFSVGPRFHGNVSALLSGIPALFVHHCQRVNEMIDWFGFPNVPTKQYFQILEESHYDLSVFEQYLDYTTFNERYPALYDNYKNFLTMNELKLMEG